MAEQSTARASRARSKKTETVEQEQKAPAKRTRAAATKTASPRAVKKTEKPEPAAPAEVIGDDSFDTRAASRRLAALRALGAGIKAEDAELSATLIRQAEKLGVASFSTEFGKLTVASRKPTFKVDSNEALIQFFRDIGAGEFITESVTVDASRQQEVIDVLTKHAPHLLKREEFVPEYLEVSFMDSLEARTEKVVTPVLDTDGNPIVVSEVNPMTGEVVDTPTTTETVSHFAVRKASVEVPQNDGSTVTQSIDERVDFVTVIPGTTYVSYPASKEQRDAKAAATAFFETGDLSITRAIPRLSK